MFRRCLEQNVRAGKIHSCGGREKARRAQLGKVAKELYGAQHGMLHALHALGQARVRGMLGVASEPSEDEAQALDGVGGGFAG